MGGPQILCALADSLPSVRLHTQPPHLQLPADPWGDLGLPLGGSQDFLFLPSPSLPAHPALCTSSSPLHHPGSWGSSTGPTRAQQQQHTPPQTDPFSPLPLAVTWLPSGHSPPSPMREGCLLHKHLNRGARSQAGVLILLFARRFSLLLRPMARSSSAQLAGNTPCEQAVLCPSKPSKLAVSGNDG